jgi:hypothetical protein
MMGASPNITQVIQSAIPLLGAALARLSSKRG